MHASFLFTAIFLYSKTKIKTDRQSLQHLLRKTTKFKYVVNIEW